MQQGKQARLGGGQPLLGWESKQVRNATRPNTGCQVHCAAAEHQLLWHAEHDSAYAAFHSMQARGDQMIWLKREEQLQLGHTALVGVMDALLDLQAGTAAPASHLHSHHAAITDSLHRVHNCQVYGFSDCEHLHTKDRRRTDVHASSSFVPPA